tara:strand:- start:13304 stop:16585 length:3282 start_codon:yes stop_codon:yes gene_type:complete
MAIIKLGPDNFELVTLATHPVRSYTSSSAGVTGSVYVFARRSPYEKQAQSIAAFDETKLQSDSLEDLRLDCIDSAKQPTRASAEITFGGVPQDGDIIIVSDTQGKTSRFEFDAHSPTSVYSASMATRVTVNNVTGSAATAAATFNNAFKKVTASGLDIKSKFKDGSTTTVVLTQKTGGASGNTTISTQYQNPSSGSVTNLTIPSTFTGGSDAGEFRSAIELYISGVHANPESARNKKAMEIIRFEPSFKYTKDTGRKNVIKNVIMPYHRVDNPTSHYAFTNYQTLNFFTASYVPSNSALIYPNYFKDDTTYGPYTPSKAFTLSFYVNPRRTTLKASDPYVAGCITHLSSTFAVSVVSGSRKDEKGLPTSFRIMLQLSHSADVKPTSVAYTNTSNRGTSGGSSNYPGDLIFLTNDNSLQKNHWHHVAIRWGTRTLNAGSGSILIDGIQRGEFSIPSASIAPVNKTGKILASASFTFGAVPPDGTVIVMTGTNGKVRLFEFDTSNSPNLLFGVSGSNTRRIPVYGLTTGAQAASVFANRVRRSGLGLTTSVSSNAVTIKHKTGGTVGNTLIITGTGHIFHHGLHATGSERPPVVNLTASIFNPSGQQMYFGGGTNATTASVADPQGLIIGNYFVGGNLMHSSSNMVQFFNPNANTNEGVRSLAAENCDPSSFSFSNPLNAEVHDIRIYNRYLTTQEVLTSSIQGPPSYKDMLFYLPVLFTKESRKRNNLLTPFQTTRSTTDDPFNVSLSFGVGGHLVNCENYLREFVQKEYPRMFNLTASVVSGDAQVELTMNQYLYATGSVRARNLLVLPNDNGYFKPNFDLLKSGTYTTSPKSTAEMGKFVNDLGNLDLSLVTLNDLILTSSLIESLTNDESEIASQIMGSNPDNLGQAPGVVLTIYQRTRDNSSNQVVFFDASNLFYGKRIKPGSLRMHDPGLTGSISPTVSDIANAEGVVPMTLRDNSRGNIYRADSKTPHAKWSSVGNIYYDEGVMIIKSPNIPMFGKDKHTIDFKGEHDVHVMKVLVKAGAGQINSSSNPTFVATSASIYANDTSTDFVYITGINFHDDNFNIVTKTNFAQPVVKRSSDEFLFKTKIDF